MKKKTASIRPSQIIGTIKNGNSKQWGLFQAIRNPADIILLHCCTTNNGALVRTQNLIAAIEEIYPQAKVGEIIISSFHENFRGPKEINWRLTKNQIWRTHLSIRLPTSLLLFSEAHNKLIFCLLSFCLKAAGVLKKCKLIISETHGAIDAGFYFQKRAQHAKWYSDIHGAAAEEIHYSLGTTLRARRYCKHLNDGEKKAIKFADLVITQSAAMCSHLKVKHSSPELNTIHFSCGVDTDRFFFSLDDRRKFRNKLNWTDSTFGICYFGNTSMWQKITEMLKIWHLLAKQVPQDLRFLLATNDPTDQIEQKLEEIGFPLEKITIRSVSRDEVPKYLSASDLGFLLRDDHILNRVASPTKFGEYLSCGLSVVSSPVAKHWIADFELLQSVICILPDENFTNTENIAIIKNFISKSMQNGPENREAARRYACLALDRARDTDRLKKFLSNHTEDLK